MPEREFELYLDLLARLLRMSPKQKEAIASELRDHLEARFEELVRAGAPRDKAIRQALEEFGDTAGLAHQFTQLSRRQMRDRRHDRQPVARPVHRRTDGRRAL